MTSLVGGKHTKALFRQAENTQSPKNTVHACANYPPRMRELQEVVQLHLSWYRNLLNFTGEICMLWLNLIRNLSTSYVLEHSILRANLFLDVYAETVI